MNILDQIKKKLDTEHANYTLHKVPEGTGTSVAEHIKAFNLDFSDGCATLIFSTENGFIALMRRDDCKIDNKKLKKELGVKNVRFATAEELKQVTGFEVGMVSPLLLNIPIFIDTLVLEKETVRVGTGGNEVSLEINVKDLIRTTEARVIEVCALNIEPKTSNLKRILTGDRPTGPLHLGHYVGSLKNRVLLQDEYETFIMCADVQALTDNYDNSEKVRQNVFQVIQDNIAVGLDPEKVTFFIQSAIPEIAELTIFFMNLVKHAEVLRNPTVKTEIAQKGFEESVPFGFVAYPVSQAADILFLRSQLVPVGDDQKPMIELASEIGKRFNRIYKSDIFSEVKGKYSEMGRLVGTDGNAKMSKSLGNCIYLQDDAETVLKKVMGMYTDPNRIRPTDPGTVEGNPVFIYHDAFNTNTEEVNELKDRYRKGTVGDVEVKQKLAIAINAFLDPIRARRALYPIEKVKEIAMNGCKKAKLEGEKTMEMVKKAMMIEYF